MDRQLFGTNLITSKIQRNNIPEVHGVKKILNTNSLPEKQKIAPQLKKGYDIKPRLGKGRMEIKHKNHKLLKILTN